MNIENDSGDIHVCTSNKDEDCLARGKKDREIYSSADHEEILQSLPESF